MIHSVTNVQTISVVAERFSLNGSRFFLFFDTDKLTDMTAAQRSRPAPPESANIPAE